MKQVLRFPPIFNPVAQTLNFNGFNDGAPFNQSCLMAILNDTQSSLIYAVGQPGLGGTLSANVLTLQYNTSTHNSSDVLTILYDENYSPLPVGAAVSANQSAIASDGGSMVHMTNIPSTQNVFVINEQSLQSVTGNVSITNLPVTQNVNVSSGSVNVSNFPTTQNVAITSVTGAVPVSGVFYQATQPISGTVSVGNLPSTQNVSLVSSGYTQNVNVASGSVNVSNFPATQAISGTVSISSFPTTQNVAIVGAPITQNVNITSVTGAVPVSGVFYQATQPVSGTVSISTFPTTQNVSLVTSSYTQNVNVASGSVNVSNFPATQVVSIATGSNTIGTVVVGNTLNVAAAIVVSNTTTWSSGSAYGSSGATLTTSTVGMSTVMLTLIPTTPIAGGQIMFEVNDGTSNWYSIEGVRTSGSGYVVYNNLGSVPTTLQSWSFMVAGTQQFRARLATVITGTGTLQLVTNVSNAAPDPLVVTGLDPNQAQHPGVLTLTNATPVVLAVATGTSTATTSAVLTTTNRVILTSTVDCWVSFGTTPTATIGVSGSLFLPASCPSYPIAVSPNSTKIAVISNNTSTGYLSILESN